MVLSVAAVSAPRLARTLRRGAFLIALGVAFGFISAVAAIGWASAVRLPSGIAPKDYVTLGRRGADTGLFHGVASQDFERLRNAVPEVLWAYADHRRPMTVRGADGGMHPARSRSVSASFFALFGVPAVAGTLTASAAGTVAVVGEAFARRTFGSVDAALQYEVRDMLDRPAPIMGVAGGGFQGAFGEDVDVWTLDPPTLPASAGATPGTYTTIMRNALTPIGVLTEGASIASAQNLVEAFRFAPGRGYMAATERDRAELVPGIERRPDARREVLERLVWLGVVVALLLALAFMAVLDQLLAEHYRRQDSETVRLAVGATPADVFLASIWRHLAWLAATGLVVAVSFLYIADVLTGLEPFASYIGEFSFAQSVGGVAAGIALLTAAFALSAGAVSRFVSRASWAAARVAKSAPALRQSPVRRCSPLPRQVS